MSTNEKGMPQSRTYTVNDIAVILSIGRGSAYKLANFGLLKPIRIGNIGSVKEFSQNGLQGLA